MEFSNKNIFKRFILRLTLSTNILYLCHLVEKYYFYSGDNHKQNVIIFYLVFISSLIYIFYGYFIKNNYFNEFVEATLYNIFLSIIIFSKYPNLIYKSIIMIILSYISYIILKE